MADKQVDFVDGVTPVMADWLDRMQEIHQALLWNANLSISGTSVVLTAGTVENTVGAVINGKMRYVNSNLSVNFAALPAGTYGIWITTTATDSSPSFALSASITTPAGTYIRKIAQITWSGSAFTSPITLLSPYTKHAGMHEQGQADALSLAAVPDIPTAKIQDGAVTPPKIQDSAVTQGKLGQGWAAKITTSTPQTLNRNVTSTIVFSTEVYDTDNMTNIGTNNDRITITHSGLYVVYGDIQFQSWGSVGAIYQYIINEGVGGIGIIKDIYTGSFNNTMGFTGQLTAIAFLVAGSYIRVKVQGDGGGGSWVTQTAELSAARIAGI